MWSLTRTGRGVKGGRLILMINCCQYVDHADFRFEYELFVRRARRGQGR